MNTFCPLSSLQNLVSAPRSVCDGSRDTSIMPSRSSFLKISMTSFFAQTTPFSQKKLANKDASDAIRNSSALVYNSIIEDSALPAFCRIVISTSTLKEGVDINNENIVMFCENHVLSNLIQFFGRARYGDSEVYVIEDAVDHPVMQNTILYEYAESEAQTANQHYKEKESNNQLWHAEKRTFIEHIKKNPYIFFDYLNNEFKVFNLKYQEETRLLNNVNWKKDLLSHCERHGINAFCFDMSALYRKGLHCSAEHKTKFTGNQIESIRYLLYGLYHVDKKHPSKINEELKNKDANIRIHHYKGTKGEERDKTYWQVLFLDDYQQLKRMRKNS